MVEQYNYYTMRILSVSAGRPSGQLCWKTKVTIINLGMAVVKMNNTFTNSFCNMKLLYTFLPNVIVFEMIPLRTFPSQNITKTYYMCCLYFFEHLMMVDEEFKKEGFDSLF